MIGFVGMETSGKIRRRLIEMGLDAYSCDLLPADDGEERRHLQMDVFDALDLLWSMNKWPHVSVWHPDCTYLTGAAAWAFKDPDYDRYPGVGYHQRLKEGTLFGAERRAAQADALDQFERIRKLPIRVKIIENPVGAISRLWKPNVVVQPYECGHDASKKTCLWVFDKEGNQIENFPFEIDPSKRVSGRMVPRELAMGKTDRARSNKGPEFIERWGNQTDTGQNRLQPSDDRWKDRSETFDGIADFIVDGIGNYLGI